MARTIDLGKVVGEGGGGGLVSDPRENESAESPELGSVPINADQLGGMTYQMIVDMIYPIGRTITTLDDDDNPNTMYPWQTWEKTAKGRMIIGTGASENNDDGTSPGNYNMALGSKSGEAMHTLTVNEMPEHNHSTYRIGNAKLNAGGGSDLVYVGGDWGQGTLKTTDAGGSQPFNNMPPYIAANIWKRVS